jgi:hypothetical protein
MTRRYRKDHDLMGREADDLLTMFDTLREEDIWQYRYPDDAQLHAVGVRGIYLGNFVRWDPKAQHEQMIERFEYRSARFARSFDAYDHVDCWNFMDVHDQLKLYKHGYSKVTDHACREIRHGRLTREQALALVRRHEQAPLQHLDKFCEWLDVDRSGLQFMMDRWRNPAFWQQESPGRWHFDGCSLAAGDANVLAADTVTPAAQFHANDVLAHDGIEGYITVGKGHP